MSDVTNDSNSSFLAGFVMGGLFGAAVALIFAPQSGSHTRASFINRGVTLQRSVNKQSRMVNGTTEGSYFGDEGKHDVPTNYEPPRIILDENSNASNPPDKM